MVFAADGQLLLQAQQEFACNYPHEGWVEQDPEQIWLSVLTVCREVLEQARQQGIAIKGIGITNQRETTLVWRRDNFEAVYPAIVWQDRRTASYCEALKARGVEPFVQQKTGLCLDPYFSASKLHWILQQHPDIDPDVRVCRPHTFPQAGASRPPVAVASSCASYVFAHYPAG